MSMALGWLIGIVMHQGFSQGTTMEKLTIRGVPLEIYAYKPPHYSGDKMIMVFHGVNRNADEYRDHAKTLGDRFNALIIAPKFDTERFPSRRYQRGGILKEDGSAAPTEDWTYAFIPDLAKAIREKETRPKMKYWLIGHSAGGQFLVRLAAFQKTDAERIVAANAGSQLFPTTTMNFGYGYGKLPPELASETLLRQYLAQPLTLYQGSGDNVPDEYFDGSAEANQQGGGRYQRGFANFEFAKKLAAEKGWEFNWRFVVARGVVHDHEAMFKHPIVEIALFGKYDSANSK